MSINAPEGGVPVAPVSQNNSQENATTVVPESTAIQGEQVQQPQVAAVENVGGVDTSFAEYFDNITPPQQNYGYPQQGYPQYQNFNPIPYTQPQQPQSATNLAVYQQPPQQQQAPVQQEAPKPAPVQIDYEKMGQLLDEGDTKGFVSELENLIASKAQSLFEEKQQGLTQEFEKTVQQKFSEQEYKQTVGYMTPKVLDGLANSNIALSQPELIHLGNIIESDYLNGIGYQNYLQHHSALKATNQLANAKIPKNRNGSAVSKEDYYIAKHLNEVRKVKSGNQQLRPAGNVVSQTMNPVVQGGSPAQYQQSADYSAMDNKTFIKDVWSQIK